MVGENLNLLVLKLLKLVKIATKFLPTMVGEIFEFLWLKMAKIGSKNLNIKSNEAKINQDIFLPFYPTAPKSKFSKI